VISDFGKVIFHKVVS